MKLVVDTLGGDNGATEIIEAIKLFKGEHPDVEIFAVGMKEDVDAIQDIAHPVYAKSILPMEAGVLEAMRDKESSMYVAVETLLKENADGIISSGSTGAYLSLATLKIKKIPGVIRPALITSFPTIIDNQNVVLLDVGANNENTKEELAQFAKMGLLYSQIVFHKENPHVYLVSNGSEKGKGSPLVKEAYSLLEKEPFFFGNMEARDILKGDADVVVFDGFTGNVYLKGSEGMAKMMSGLMKDAFKRSIFSKIGYLFAKKGFDELKSKMDYKKVGGALLVGVNSVVVKAHGNSDRQSFKAAMNVAYNLMDKRVVQQIKEPFLGA